MSERARRLVARNASLGTVIADKVGVAASRTARAVGLLTRSSLEPGEALWIVPSRGVHTWGMRFTIDVLALDEAGTVIDCVSNLRPWRVRLPRKGTAGVLELPAGTLQASNTSVGHRVVLELGGPPSPFGYGEAGAR
jgi:uncharacterized membrane protein (UPF0127 family)